MNNINYSFDLSRLSTTIIDELSNIDIDQSNKLEQFQNLLNNS